MQPLDILILLFIGIGIFAGYRKGFFNQIASLIGILVGFYLAKTYYIEFAEKLYPVYMESQSLANIISFVGIWFILLIVLGILSSMLTQFFDAIYLGVINQLLGAILGAIKYFILLSILLCSLDYFDADHKWLSEEIKNESMLYKPIMVVGKLLFFTVKGAYLSS